MDPITIALLGQGIGGLASLFANMSAQDRANALQNQGLQQWINIHIPDPAQQQLALQQFVQTGKLDPVLEKSIQQNPTEFQNIVTSQANKTAQDRALQELQNIGNEGGLRLQDKASLQDAMLQSEAKERGDRMALQQQMAQRGLGGSGFEFASQLQNQQSAADRNAKSSLDIAAQAQDRALKSLMDSGQLATQYQNQDFNQQAQRAQAQDAINRFNTQNMQGVQERNVASQNAAQQYNLNQQQKTSDMNTQLANQEQQYNKGLLQQQFNNQANVAAGATGQYNNLANNAYKQGQTNSNIFGNIGSAVSGVGQSIYNKRNKDEEDEE